MKRISVFGVLVCVMGTFVAGRVVGEGNVLPHVKSATLSFEVFDSDGGRYGPKHVWCNGMVIGLLPVKLQSDTWEKGTMPLPPDALWVLQRRNVLRVIQPGGDSFKFRNLQLTVTHADGSVSRSAVDETVHCSTATWAYSEGTTFVDQRYSAEIQLVLN